MTPAAGVDIVELFVERVGDYRATVHARPRPSLPAAIAAVARGHPGAGASSCRPGSRRLARERSTSSVVADDPPLVIADLDALDGVITGCAVAIAETGTIVLDGGAGQGRRALSLLPDLHVCVVRADQIVGDVPEALARLTRDRPQTWISGPSATSDIELQRVEGVHGPRRLDVIIVEA